MKTYLYPLLAGLMGLAACTQDDMPADPTEETAAVTFRVGTRAEGETPDRLARLYIGERKPEHFTEDTTHLHVNQIVDFKDRTVTVSGLKPQWYKFAFVSVPRIEGTGTGLFTETDPKEGSCDLNDQMIDYKPILLRGPGTTMPDKATPDGDIFRKVINRWTLSGEMVSEDVTMNRLNGQLVIDMGVLEDQFDCDGFTQGEVIVTVTVNDIPTRLYLTDNDADEIKTADNFNSMSWQTQPQPNDVSNTQDPKEHHIITLNLLPCTLSGSVTVKTPKAKEGFTYPLQGTGGQLSIKQNTRTKLTFNGIADGHFSVKYAGFSDTQIDVDTDEWDGWKE